MISLRTAGLAVVVLLTCVITCVNCDDLISGVNRRDRPRPAFNLPTNNGFAERPGDSVNDHREDKIPLSPGGLGDAREGLILTRAQGDRDAYVDPTEEEEEEDSLANESNLCRGDCLCNHDDSVVSCEHEHVEEEHSDRHNMTLSAERLPENVDTLRLIGFDQLEIMPDTFAGRNLSLMRLIFKNIKRLILYPGSLRFHTKSQGNTVIQVSFEDCSIPEIPEGAITQDSPNNSGGDIELGLEDTRFLTFQFTDCTIDVIKTNAIADARFFYLEMINSKITFMEEKSIDAIVYEEFQMKDSFIPALPKNSICVITDSAVIFSGNVMKKVTGFAFNITSDSQVLFEYNRVEELDSYALLGIHPKKNSRAANIVFLNNTLNKAQPMGLVISNKYKSHERKIQNNNFNIICRCNISEVFGSYLGTTDYQNRTLLVVMDDSMCITPEESGVYERVRDFMDRECSALPWPIILSVVLVAIMILVTTAVILFCSKRLKQVKEESCYIVDGSMPSFSTIQSYPAHLNPGHAAIEGPISPSWIMAVPEVKTYQETEVHVLYEQTEPINSSRVSYHDSTYDNHKKCQARASCPFN
ncbi:uncharacterized protein LOC143039595 [Oratosquilla oratoria]|uniref:uncharacterized protein LOC143039595 n=1 Tax=Oratosquilla oratoria TaxID=337810 RepID=UPI003F776FC5